MKKVLKWAAILIGVAVIGVGALAAYINWGYEPMFEAKPPQIKVASTPEMVARGRKIAVVMCAKCHADPYTRKLTGTEMIDLPPEFGVAYSRNITNHKELGIGGWSDGDIIYLLRTGIHPHTGRYLPPWMPKFNKMSDEEMFSIIAFLRSDDPLVEPTSVKDRDCKPSFLAKALMFAGVFKPFEYPTKPIHQPDTNDKVKWGRYLAVDMYDCWGCHSGDFQKMDAENPEKSFDFFGGGNMPLDATRSPVMSANLTPDPETGIGKWTEQQFITTLKTGIKPNGRPLRAPMFKEHMLTDSELGAMFAYLQTVPKIKKVIPATDHVPSSSASAGEKHYFKYECVRCHGTKGSGYADLRPANSKYQDDSVLADVIRNINTYYSDSYMPNYAGVIKDDEYAALVKYVRSLGEAHGN